MTLGLLAFQGDPRPLLSHRPLNTSRLNLRPQVCTHPVQLLQLQRQSATTLLSSLPPLGQTKRTNDADDLSVVDGRVNVDDETELEYEEVEVETQLVTVLAAVRRSCAVIGHPSEPKKPNPSMPFIPMPASQFMFMPNITSASSMAPAP